MNWRRAATAWAFALTAVTAASSAAQTTSESIALRVVVTDTARAPIEGADVAVMIGPIQVASSATDRGGVHTFRLNRSGAGYQVIVRRVGYVADRRLVSASDRDTVFVNIILQRAAQELSAVNVTAQMSAKRAAQSIDAGAIAASGRPLVDAVDIILKLRPAMVWGIRGPPVLDDTLWCPALMHVWVNGHLIRNLSADAGLAMRRTQDSLALHQRQRNTLSVTTPVLVPTPLMAISLEALTVLASIKPEHIESMEYRSCDEITDPRPNTSSAMFVTLKAGLEFEAGRGSFVPKGLASQTAAAALAQTLPEDRRYRARLLGLFDSDNGNPIAAADVTEVSTGATARTSSTGTVALTFVHGTGGVLSVSRAGYQTDTVTVAISPADTTPVMLLLHKRR